MNRNTHLILVFLWVFFTKTAWTQSNTCNCKADHVQLYSLEKEEYHFSFTDTSQGLCFDQVVYDQFPRIIVKVWNRTQDTIINFYKERDAHIFWLRENQRFDTIYPGQAMVLKGLGDGHSAMGLMNLSTLYLRFQIKDSTYTNSIRICGSMYPSGHMASMREEVYEYYPSGKVKQVQYLGKPKSDVEIRLKRFFENGCTYFENYTNRFQILYDSTKCDCPVIGKTKGGGVLTYFNCSLDSAERIEKFENYTDLGTFDLKGELKTGSRTYKTYYDIEKLVFHRQNYAWLESFELITSYYALEGTINTDLILPYDSVYRIVFNQTVNGEKVGVWLQLDESVNDFVKRFTDVHTAIPKDVVFRYPWSIYRNGQLVETHFFSEQGTLIKKEKHLDDETVTENYTHDVLGPPGLKSTPAYCKVLVHTNGTLSHILTPRIKMEFWSGDFNSHEVRNVAIPFTLQTGEFIDQTLINGSIAYYDEKGYLVKTTTMINGVESE